MTTCVYLCLQRLICIYLRLHLCHLYHVYAYMQCILYTWYHILTYIQFTCIYLLYAYIAYPWYIAYIIYYIQCLLVYKYAYRYVYTMHACIYCAYIRVTYIHSPSSAVWRSHISFKDVPQFGWPHTVEHGFHLLKANLLFWMQGRLLPVAWQWQGLLGGSWS